MNIYDMFDINKKTETYLNEDSTWTQISHYLMFLTLRNGGCSKSDSGSLRVIFPTHWDENMVFTAEIGGNDIPNMRRHEEISARSEIDLKLAIIKKLCKVRDLMNDDLQVEKQSLRKFG